jgi:hypothetical protein
VDTEIGKSIATRAQQGERMRRVGVLMGFEENDLEANALLSAFEALRSWWGEGEWCVPPQHSPGKGGRTKSLGAAIPLKTAGTALHRRPEASSFRVPPIPTRHPCDHD